MLQIYTGNGKGKSTAAFGMALRALGAGMKVFIAQFVKDMKYSECCLEECFSDRLQIEQWGIGCLLEREATEEDYRMTRMGLERVAPMITKGGGDQSYDLVILDELTIALSLKLLELEEVLELLRHRREECEVIITGRYAPSELIEMADLVTDMQEVKHYYQKGVLSRKGYDC